MKAAALLVFAGKNAEAIWEKRGLQGAVDLVPQVLFAIAPELNTISLTLPSEASGDFVPGLMWYRCICGPLQKASVRISTLQEHTAQYDAGRFVHVPINIVGRGQDQATSIGFVVDEQGVEVREALVIPEMYRRLADQLPDPGSFYLDDLPPIIHVDSNEVSAESTFASE